MTRAREPRLATPWEVRLSIAAPVHPLALGMLLWIALAVERANSEVED